MDLADEVYKIISRHCLRDPASLSNELYLEQDLKLAGDDIGDLLDEVNEKFDIDFSDFDFSLHFSLEAGWPENPDYGYYPVTVGHLVEVVRLKRWFLPEKNEANYLGEKRHRLILKSSLFFISLLIIIFILSTKILN